MYVVVTDGLAVGFAMLVVLRFVDGLQAYDGPPLPCKIADVPSQITVSLPADATGCGKAVTTIEAVSEQPVAPATTV